MRMECCMSHLKGSNWEDVDVCLQEMVETVFVPRRLCLEAELGALDIPSWSDADLCSSALLFKRYIIIVITV